MPICICLFWPLQLENIASGLRAEFRNSGFLCQVTKMRKIVSGQIVTELRGGRMWRARTWGREQLASDKLRTLPKSTTTCLVHAFKQVAHKLIHTELYTCTDVWTTCKHWHGHARWCTYNMLSARAGDTYQCHWHAIRVISKFLNVCVRVEIDFSSENGMITYNWFH